MLAELGRLTTADNTEKISHFSFFIAKNNSSGEVVGEDRTLNSAPILMEMSSTSQKLHLKIS